MHHTAARQSGLILLKNYNNVEANKRIIQLFDNCEVMKFHKNTLLNTPGSGAESLYYIKKGAIKVFKQNSSENFIIWIEPEGGIIGIDQLFNEGTDKLFYAVKGSEIKALPVKDAKALLKTNPELTLDTLQCISEMADRMELNIMNITQKSIICNFANLLLKLSSLKTTEIVPSVITTKDVANMVGTTTNYVYKTIQKLENNSIISFKDRKLRITNKELLKQLASEGK